MIGSFFGWFSLPFMQTISMTLIMSLFRPLSTLLGVICYDASVNWWVIQKNSKVKPTKKVTIC
jgi:hypothetical protein